MILKDSYHYIDSEKYKEDIIYSIHNYLYNGLEDLTTIEQKIIDSKYNLNNIDLYGKYNSLNFVLDNFIFYQQKRWREYPQNREPKLDFLLITYFLIKHGAQLDIKDWKRHTFIDNIQQAISLEKNNLNNNNFVTNDLVNLIYSENNKDRENIICKALSNHTNSVYSFLYLKESFKNIEKKDVKIKI